MAVLFSLWEYNLPEGRKKAINGGGFVQGKAFKVSSHNLKNVRFRVLGERNNLSINSLLAR